MMTLYEVLDKSLYNGEVMIYSRNCYDQCIKIFEGIVSDARCDEDNVWKWLMSEVDGLVYGNKVLLI